MQRMRLRLAILFCSTHAVLLQDARSVDQCGNSDHKTRTIKRGSDQCAEI